MIAGVLGRAARVVATPLLPDDHVLVDPLRSTRRRAVAAGAVRHLQTGGPESAGDGGVVVRTCVSAAAGDCRTDL